MTAKNVVRRDEDTTATIGTKLKRWFNGFFNSLNVASGTNAPVNTLQRSTAYVVGDVVTADALHAKYYLKCTTAGTTGSSDPSFTGAASGTVITDGTAKWTVQTIISSEEVAETYAPKASPTFTGNVTVPSPGASDDSAKPATTEWVDDVFLTKIFDKLKASGDLPAGVTFPSASVLSKMIANMNTQDGVQYNLSNGSAWYICLGAKYGNLIIQGGSKTYTADSAYMDFTVPLAVSTRYHMSATVKSILSSANNTYFAMNYNWYESSVRMRIFKVATDGTPSIISSNVNFSYIAFGK